MTVGLAAACGDGKLDAGEAAALLAPIHERFERFDRWSRRAIAADPAFASSAALEETLFAPLRREDDVCGAWIERTGARTVLAHGPLDTPPSEAVWVRVRDAALGEVEVSAVKIRPEGSANDAEGHRCVLVRRVRPGSDGVDVSVALGLRASE